VCGVQRIASLFLVQTWRGRLWPYLGGIARENKMKTLAIGGAADHVHILVSLPATLSIAKALQPLKGNSSKWIHETFPKMRSFEWQEGYGISEDAPAPRLGLRRAHDRLILSSLPGLVSYQRVKPSAKALGYFVSCLSALYRLISMESGRVTAHAICKMCLMPRMGMSTQLGRLFSS
jgi:Transposase IS200 like